MFRTSRFRADPDSLPVALRNLGENAIPPRPPREFESKAHSEAERITIYGAPMTVRA